MSAPPLTTHLALRLQDVILDDILPLTEASVKHGNKVFGAALLRRSDLSTYLAETNNEIESPLHHGEMHLLKRYYEIPAKERAPVADLLFLSTHEPCSLCLSAITWSGFDNFYYFFSHQSSESDFNIPHDLRILKEVFNLDLGQYRSQNAYWACHGIVDWIENCKSSLSDGTLEALNEKSSQIQERYQAVSAQYQSVKADNEIPLN